MHCPTTLSLWQAAGLSPSTEAHRDWSTRPPYHGSVSLGHLSAANSHHASHLLPPPQNQPTSHCTFLAAALWQLGQSRGVLQHSSMGEAAGLRVQPALPSRSRCSGSSVCRHPGGRRQLYPRRCQWLRSPASQGSLDCHNNTHFHPEGMSITFFPPLGITLESSVEPSGMCFSRSTYTGLNQSSVGQHILPWTTFARKRHSRIKAKQQGQHISRKSGKS